MLSGAGPHFRGRAFFARFARCRFAALPRRLGWPVTTGYPKVCTRRGRFFRRVHFRGRGFSGVATYGARCFGAGTASPRFSDKVDHAQLGRSSGNASLPVSGAGRFGMLLIAVAEASPCVPESGCYGVQLIAAATLRCPILRARVLPSVRKHRWWASPRASEVGVTACN